MAKFGYGTRILVLYSYGDILDKFCGSRLTERPLLAYRVLNGAPILLGILWVEFFLAPFFFLVPVVCFLWVAGVG